MKSTPITHPLTCEITSNAFDKRLAQVSCFVASLAVLVCSIMWLMRLELTEAQLFFGVLLSFVTPLLFIVLGLLVQMRTASKDA